MVDKRPALVVIVGPTAVGKTEVAIQLAERVNSEIVSADSRLLYRGLDIGTAKPSTEQLARVPHHLIDVANPDEIWSLALFQRAANEAIEVIHGRGRLPILVGGTGQYLRAILEGWSPPKITAQPRLRAALEAWAGELGNAGIHARLAIVDSVAAGNIDARNVRRTLRALEVILATGMRFSDQRTRADSPYRVLQIGLTRPRPELYARIDARIQQMVDAGWLNEVKALLAKGYDADLPSLSAIGYRQLIDHLKGKMSPEQAVDEIKRATRLFVRRQANWFKPTDPHIKWFEAAKNNLIDNLEKEVGSFLHPS
ncbi:MAG: tRNA (adenosine(37)-N6)-dimethylallyltransferase MiaA [Anaerolineales bacterium]